MEKASGKIPSFVHLRVHSAYSLAEGTLHPDALVTLCAKEGMPAVAVTDTGNLFGSLEFSKIAAKKGIQPIIGSIMSIDYGKWAERRQFDTQVAAWDKIVLLAKNPQGYQHLLKLVSLSFLEGRGDMVPHITLAQLVQYQEGLIVLTGGPEGGIGRLLLERKEKAAEVLLLELKRILGNRLYIELMRHGRDEEALIEAAQVAWAYQHNIPLVATNDVFFAGPDMYEAHDALLCVAGGRFVDEENRPKKNPEYYFKPAKAMAKLFADIPEAIHNTLHIAQRCAVMSQARAPILPEYPCENERDQAEELKWLAEKGLEQRLVQSVYTSDMSEDEKAHKAKPYFARLYYEAEVITAMKYPGYFLIVSDFIRWSKRYGVPVGPGRGSGAGSVVAWALEITDLDPLRFGLLFERFLNPERVSMPDFDIDFCQERRDEVIRYVQEKYGKERVAQIITFGKLQARAVIRDVGRVLQMPLGQLDKICKIIPYNPLEPVTLSKALQMDKELQRQREQDPEVSKLFDIALKLEGLYRHASTHAAGLVIGDRPLDTLIPLYRDPRSDMPVTGYSMKYAEESGLVKFDFLGLKTLTVIAKTCDLLKIKGVTLDIRLIPLDDPKTYKMLSHGDSVGVFQLESAGMRDTLRKLRPDTLEDIIALISLYRPGPMDNIPAYIARKHGTEKPDYLHPMLEPTLKETFGVIIYQEQVMQIAQVMGGYSLGGADLLRRAMGKKIASEMNAQREIFVKGAVKNGVSSSQASQIFELVAKFAGYGFNKSHAAAYALISYQTAYLKANYPVEFLAASMNLEIQDTDKINIFLQEAIRQDIPVLPPDVNRSFALFMPEQTETKGLAIRYGLGAVKNVGVTAMEGLVGERRKNGAYKDIFDFVCRLGGQALNKRLLENLIRAGACDSIHPNRRQFFEAIETLLRYGAVVAGERNSAQASLFGDGALVQVPGPKLPQIEDWKGKEKLHGEFEALGCYLTAHPLDGYNDILVGLKVKSFLALSEGVGQGTSRVHLAGVVTSRRIRSSARGRFATVNLSDSSGLFEVSVFDEGILESARDLLEVGSMVLVTAEARKDEGGLRIIVQDIISLDKAIHKHKFSYKVFFSSPEGIAQVKHILAGKEPGKHGVTLVITTPHKHVEISLPTAYSLTAAAVEELEAVPQVIKIERV